MGWTRPASFFPPAMAPCFFIRPFTLAGFGVSLDDLKNFRQLHSPTPGHPEYGETPGVEMTTGPLGQGLATAAGIALGEKMVAAKFGLENEGACRWPDIRSLRRWLPDGRGGQRGQLSRRTSETRQSYRHL